MVILIKNPVSPQWYILFFFYLSITCRRFLILHVPILLGFLWGGAGCTLSVVWRGPWPCVENWQNIPTAPGSCAVDRGQRIREDHPVQVRGLDERTEHLSDQGPQQVLGCRLWWGFEKCSEKIRMQGEHFNISFCIRGKWHWDKGIDISVNGMKCRFLGICTRISRKGH